MQALKKPLSRREALGMLGAAGAAPVPPLPAPR